MKTRKSFDSKCVHSWFCEKVWKRWLKRAGVDADAIGSAFFLSDGKRLRPILAAGIYSSLGGDNEDAIVPIALAVECFHKASLIHDDIEDGDTMRYGRPTVHAEHGVPLAINTGDWLLGVGYALLCAAEVPGDIKAELVSIASCGHAELARGQGDELAFCAAPHPISQESVIDIYARKTSAAFNVAVQCAAAAAGLNSVKRAALAVFAYAWGVAFQIHDDEEDISTIQGRSSDLCSLRPTVYLAMACRSRSPAVRNALSGAWNGGVEERRRLALAIGASSIPGRVAELRRHHVALARLSLEKIPAGPRKVLEGLLPL